MIYSAEFNQQDVPCELTFLEKLGDDAALYGLYYPGIDNCISWCYLTIAKNVVVATHTDTDGRPSDQGTSITNIWSLRFIESLKAWPPIIILDSPRWFEHYHHPIPRKGAVNDGPSIDEVFLTDKGEIRWEHIACYEFPSKDSSRVAAAFQSLTGVSIPDFSATGFAHYMNA
jgi:hypothetical protein